MCLLALRASLEIKLPSLHKSRFAPLPLDLSQHRRPDDQVPQRPDRGHVDGPEQAVWLHEDRPLAAVAADAVRDPADAADPVHGSVGDLQGPLVVGQIQRRGLFGGWACGSGLLGTWASGVRVSRKLISASVSSRKPRGCRAWPGCRKPRPGSRAGLCIRGG